MRSLLLLCCLALSASVLAQEEDGQGGSATLARLLVAKQIQNKYLVESKDIVIRYSLFNVGGSAAVDVKLNERGFGADDFDVVGGQMQVRIPRIAPGANNTHVLVVRPRKFGYFNFTAAEVSYRPSDELEQIHTGFSSDPGQGLIISLKDYERQFSAHVLDWLAFAIMTLPSVGFPFLLWRSSKAKYEDIAKAKAA